MDAEPRCSLLSIAHLSRIFIHILQPNSSYSQTHLEPFFYLLLLSPKTTFRLFCDVGSGTSHATDAFLLVSMGSQQWHFIPQQQPQVPFPVGIPRRASSLPVKSASTSQAGPRLLCSSGGAPSFASSSLQVLSVILGLQLYHPNFCLCLHVALVKEHQSLELKPTLIQFDFILT